MTRVFGWRADDFGIGQIRIQQPLAELRRQFGWEVADSLDLRHAPWKPDVLIGQRVCKGGPTSVFMQMARQNTAFCVYELDDDIWNVAPDNPAYADFGRPEIIRNATNAMLAAHRVVVSTAALAERVTELGATDVRVVANAIPDEVLNMPAIEHSDMADDGPLIVGWAGSATHGRDWQRMATPLAAFLRAAGDEVELHTIGQRYELSHQGRRRHTGWFADVRDYYRALDFHVGLAPLEPTPFNRCKSPIKAMEYAARSIPVIATNYGPYREFVQGGATGFLVRKDEEWRDAFWTLSDAGHREEMGRAARWQMLEHTVSVRAAEWREALTP